MAGDHGDDYIKQMVDCSVCLEEYRDPYALTCLHTYCYGCIKAMANNFNNIICPECRNTCSVRSAKRDFKTQTLLEMYHIKTKADVQVNGHFPVVCSVCLQANKAIVSRCVQCEEYLCENCQTAHKGMKISKSHALISVEDIVKSLLTVTDEIRLNLTSNIDVMSSSNSDISKSIEDLTTNREQQVTELNQYCQDMIRSIEQHCDKTKKLMQTESDKVINKLRKGQVELQNHIDDFQAKLDFQNKGFGYENLSLLNEKVKAGALSESNVDTVTAEAAELLKKCNYYAVKLVIRKASVWSPANVQVQIVGGSEDCVVNKRGFYISDDIKVLEEITDRMLAAEASDSETEVMNVNTCSDGDEQELVGACGSSENMSNNNLSSPLIMKGEESKISPAFSKLMTKSYAKAGYLKKNSGVMIHTMCVVNDSLWCAVKTPSHNFIRVYDEQCLSTVQIKNAGMKNIKALAYEEGNDHVVVACCEEFGLHLVSAKGVYLMKIRDGSYFSVSIHDKKIYALANSTKPMGDIGIVVLKQQGSRSWIKCSHLKSTELFYHQDRIVAHQQGVHVSRNLQLRDEAVVIAHHMLSQDLKSVESTISKKQLNERMGNKQTVHTVQNRPCAELLTDNAHNYYILCQADKYGNLLVFEKHSQKLSICDSADNFHSCPIQQMLGMNWVGKNRVLVADITVNQKNSDVWVVTETHDIIRYSLV